MMENVNNFLTEIIDEDIAAGLTEKIHTRFPPEPNGYLHIGSAKAIFINWSISKKYGGKFNYLHHFFGYEGRAAFPSNFDADYCYSLGYTACLLINAGCTGYMSYVKNLASGVDEWAAGGMPITKMMDIERRGGKDKPVIRKALVDLEGKPFKEFSRHRAKWASETCFHYPGAIQYFGPEELADATTITLRLESEE